MLDLAEIRQKIDRIDHELVALYEERMKLCGDVAQYKIETGKKVLDSKREQEKLAAIEQMVSDENDKHGVNELFTQIMAMSRKMQYKLLEDDGKTLRLPYTAIDSIDKVHCRVVYQGVCGAYSHIATRQFFGENVNCYHVDTWRDAMEAVKNGEADYAVLPIENSTAGVVAGVMDLLQEYDNYIIAEVSVKVEHALVGLDNTDMDKIKVVYSHPQALAQCSKYLEEHPDWQQISTTNTAVSAKRVLEEQDSTHVAIASEEAAGIFGLKVLKTHLNYNDMNITRFAVISKERKFVKGAKKMSICMEITHEPGSLYNLLSHMIYNGLNMTRIESRPIVGREWEYRFFIDFEGNINDEGVLNALHGIEEEASAIKFLGNY